METKTTRLDCGCVVQYGKLCTHGQWRDDPEDDPRNDDAQEPDHSIPYDGCSCGDPFCEGCDSAPKPANY
jgi:hypothetical protein